MEISSAYVGETWGGVKPTPQALQHEFMNSHLFCWPTQQLTLISVVKFSFALGPKGRSALFLVFWPLGWYTPTDILSLTNATCNIYSNVTHFNIMISPTNGKRGWYGNFVIQDLGLALVAKKRPDRPQATKGANIGQATAKGGKTGTISRSTRYTPGCSAKSDG